MFFTTEDAEKIENQTPKIKITYQNPKCKEERFLIFDCHFAFSHLDFNLLSVFSVVHEFRKDFGCRTL
jgi:hypothetical protein